jgi:hypothetical protein
MKSKTEDKLLFILYILTCYPLFDAIAAIFSRKKGSAYQWIHRLTKVMKIALGKGDYLPSIQPENVKAALENSSTQELKVYQK